jgi:metal-responsive CopG/Arc/MetJ family transcriptional regulator
MTKDHISVSIDTHLLATVEQLAADLAVNRDDAIEAAIKDWCDRQAKLRVQQAYEQQRRRQEQDETGWLV